ncbi:MAG TPA: transposase [Lacunisphaera sp.]
MRSHAIFFITLCCSPRNLNQLCKDAIAEVIWESIEFRQKRHDWYVHLWLLMPDHLHALIAFPDRSDPSKVIANWKEIIAKKTCVKWQRDFFDHRLRSNESLEEKSQYILQNPVRKNFVTKPEDWKFVWQAT